MVDRELIEKVRLFVKSECDKPGANYSTAYDLHFVSVSKIAVGLAEKFSADVEIVEIAIWLHDIGSIMVGRDNHHITGAKIAAEKLRSFGYPEEKIDRVTECILNHRGSKENENERLSIEAKIIAEADALDSFDNMSKQFLITLVYEKKSLEEAKASVLRKLKNKWNQLEFKESKDMVRSKYEAALVFLS